MTEFYKNVNAGKETLSNIRTKASDLTHEAVETIQENRPLMYAGIAALCVGAGLGIWALVRQFRGTEEPISEFCKEAASHR